MRIAYLDMFSGVSGDMLLGACLDAGLSIEELRVGLEPLRLEGVAVSVEPIERHGIAASRCRVEVEPASRSLALPEILDLISGADLPATVVERSRAVFERLAIAEAKVHGTTVDEVHFHEVGAIDAIVDIVGAIWCFHRLRVDEVRASRFAIGRGWIEADHGSLPVPAPAVIDLVAGWPIVQCDVDVELTTPTGAALVTTLATGVGMPADFVPETIGYGGGTRDLVEHPNLLRVVLGSQAVVSEEMAIVECDLDDLSPQLFEPLAGALYAAGASEVHWMPVQMKKNRPGVTVRVLTSMSHRAEVGDRLFGETTTIGYRWWRISRETLAREEVEVETTWGRVRAKRIRRRDGSWETRPEFESCRAIAESSGLPVREVVMAVTAELNRMRAPHNRNP